MTKPYKSYVETLGDLRDHGMGLFAHCARPGVGHGARLDLGALIERYGEDYAIIGDTAIESACRCRQCGWLGARINLVANQGPG